MVNGLIWSVVRSPDAKFLLVSSTDGYCTVITFDEGELGDVYVKEPSVTSEEVKEATGSEKSTSGDANG